MKSSLLIIAGILLVVCAADIFGMGKSDGPKKKVEEPLKKAPAGTPVTVKPAKPPVKKPVETKPLDKPAKTTEATPEEKPLDKNKVVVRVNGVPVTVGEVEERLDKSMEMEISRMNPATISQLPPDALKSLRQRRRKSIIDGLVMEHLIDQKIKQLKIELTDKDVDEALTDIRTRNKMTPEEFQKQLAASGINMETLREQLKRRIGLEKMLEREMKAAGEPSEPTEEEAKKFYDDNQARFSTPEQVRASHILIKADKNDEEAKAAAKKKITDLLKRARAGEDFAELARQYSEDPGSKARGGEYTFPRKRMVKPFEDAAFSLEVGQISDIVETTYGYHIIKLLEKIPAETTSYADAREDIIKNLANQKKGRFWMTKLQPRLKAEAKLEWSAEEKARMEKEKASTPPPTIKPPTK